MKIVFLFFSMFFVSSALADPLDYDKEAAVATKEAYQSYSKGDMKTLQFALERLTISCNMMALDGLDLPSSCVSWFAVLKEECGTGLEEKVLRECARKFYHKRTRSRVSSHPPPSPAGSPPPSYRVHLEYTFAKIFKDTLASFGQAYKRNVYQKTPHLAEKMQAQWAEFLDVYSYYKERALEEAMSGGDRQLAEGLLANLTHYAREEIRY